MGDIGEILMADDLHIQENSGQGELTHECCQLGACLAANLKDAGQKV